MQFYHMIGRIKGFRGEVIGPSYVDGNGKFHKGIELIDLIDQIAALPKDVLEIEIPVATPGGHVDVGNDMFDYLDSLKLEGKKITTIQNGLIGSIGTKIFLAGDRRISDPRYEFWIHNPYVENFSGDKDAFKSQQEALDATEKDLIKFYSQFTGITSVGIDALMKIETGIKSAQLLKYGFATEEKAAPVFNVINTKSINKMSKTKDEKSLKEQLLNILGVKADPKGVQPKAKAEIPGGEKKSLVVTLAEGAGAFWVEGDAVSVGAPAFLLDADGQPTAEPLADGDYPAEDGSMITVSDGMISAVTPAEESEVENPLTAEAVAEMINAALAKAQTEIAKVKEEAKKETESKIMALKGQIKLGIQPTKGVLNGSNGQKLEYKSISQRMADQAEERKKQLNKN